MHALLITFTSDAELEALAEPFRAHGEALPDVPGLISKTWLLDGETIGGFYVFEHSTDAQVYLDGDLSVGVTANPAVAGFVMRHFDVTAVTGPVPARRAGA